MWFKFSVETRSVIGSFQLTAAILSADFREVGLVVMIGDDSDGSSGHHGPSPASHDSIDMRVGQRIKDRRETLGLSIEELALLVEVSPQFVREFEAGSKRVPPTTFAEIASNLGMSISWFFEQDND